MEITNQNNSVCACTHVPFGGAPNTSLLLTTEWESMAMEINCDCNKDKIWAKMKKKNYIYLFIFQQFFFIFLLFFIFFSSNFFLFLIFCHLHPRVVTYTHICVCTVPSSKALLDFYFFHSQHLLFYFAIIFSQVSLIKISFCVLSRSFTYKFAILVFYGNWYIFFSILFSWTFDIKQHTISIISRKIIKIRSEKSFST